MSPGSQRRRPPVRLERPVRSPRAAPGAAFKENPGVRCPERPGLALGPPLQGSRQPSPSPCSAPASAPLCFHPVTSRTCGADAASQTRR